MRIKDEPSIRLEYLLRTNQTLLTLVYYQGELKTRMIKKNAKKRGGQYLFGESTY